MLAGSQDKSVSIWLSGSLLSQEVATNSKLNLSRNGFKMVDPYMDESPPKKNSVATIFCCPYDFKKWLGSLGLHSFRRSLKSWSILAGRCFVWVVGLQFGELSILCPRFPAPINQKHVTASASIEKSHEESIASDCVKRCGATAGHPAAQLCSGPAASYKQMPADPLPSEVHLTGPSALEHGSSV